MQSPETTCVPTVDRLESFSCPSGSLLCEACVSTTTDGLSFYSLLLCTGSNSLPDRPKINRLFSPPWNGEEIEPFEKISLLLMSYRANLGVALHHTDRQIVLRTAVSVRTKAAHVVNLHVNYSEFTSMAVCDKNFHLQQSQATLLAVSNF